MICNAQKVSQMHRVSGRGSQLMYVIMVTCQLLCVVICCSPFETVDTAGQFSHAQQPAFTHQTSAPLYANDAIANSGTLYEEIATDDGAGTMRVMVRALYDYEAVEDDEISLTAGNDTSYTSVVSLWVLVWKCHLL